MYFLLQYDKDWNGGLQDLVLHEVSALIQRYVVIVLQKQYMIPFGRYSYLSSVLTVQNIMFHLAIVVNISEGI